MEAIMLVQSAKGKGTGLGNTFALLTTRITRAAGTKESNKVKELLHSQMAPSIKVISKLG